MQPKRDTKHPQRELFQIDLEQLIDMGHGLVRLGAVIDWQSFEQSLGGTYHPSQGAPGISTRLMVALHYLKYQHDLSDEDVVALWVENPYWQHFSGMKHFQHRAPGADRCFEHDALAQASRRCGGRADAARHD